VPDTDISTTFARGRVKHLLRVSRQKIRLLAAQESVGQADRVVEAPQPTSFGDSSAVDGTGSPDVVHAQRPVRISSDDVLGEESPLGVGCGPNDALVERTNSSAASIVGSGGHWPT